MKKLISTVIVAAILATLLVPQLPVFAADYNYGEALQKAILFYEFQMAGKLPDNMRTNWRGDSCLNDGKDVGLDLTGGWFDAGDHVKFNLPMAYTAAMLAWTVHEYKDALQKSGQLSYMMDQIKWAADYFIKCHPEKYVYYYQVGNGDADHRWWVPAECIDLQAPRPSYKVTQAAGGSTVTAGTAAALAATALIFKDTDPAYAAKCLQHAKDLYEFSELTKSDAGYIEAMNFYRSWSGWSDELSWAGAWIYMASGDQTYLDKAEQYVSEWGLEQRTTYIAYKWGHCWDDVHHGASILLAKLTDKPLYKESIERHLDYWTVGYNGERIRYTPKGLAHLTDWGVLRHATTTAFLASVYSDWSGCPPEKAAVYMDFAKKQTDYALGSSGRSYEIGFGVNPPKRPHHRTAHSSWADSQNVPAFHRHTLYGALVGGPSSTDAYDDDIANYVTNEVACDYNAGFVGVLAKMYDLYGGEPIPNFKAIEEKTNEEIFVSATAGGTSAAELRSRLFNKSGWPARSSDKLSFRYFMDLSEYISGGGNPGAITGTIVYSAAPTAKISAPKVYDASKNIYYVEVDLTGSKVFPGSNSDHQKEIQFKIQPPAGSKWDNTNDFSYQGIQKGGEAIKELPVYDAGVLIFGVEPNGSTPPPPPTPTVIIPTPSIPSFKYGDVNNDGLVNSTDYTLVKRVVLKIIPDFPNAGAYPSNLAADVNADGAINSTDLTLIKRHILKIITIFPAETK